MRPRILSQVLEDARWLRPVRTSNLAAAMAENEGGRDRDFLDKARALLSSFLKKAGHTCIKYPADDAANLGSSEAFGGAAYVVF